MIQVLLTVSYLSAALRNRVKKFGWIPSVFDLN